MIFTLVDSSNKLSLMMIKVKLGKLLFLFWKLTRDEEILVDMVVSSN